MRSRILVSTLLCLPLSWAESRFFLWLSDIHLDPFYGTESAVNNCRSSAAPAFGQIGCDSPLALLQSAFQQAASKLNETTFCIITGDMARHSTDTLPDPLKDTQQILHNVSQLLVDHLPDSTIFVPALGNNDVTPDYYFDVHNPTRLLQMVGTGLASILPDPLPRSFRTGGYLARNVTSQLTIVSLNTLLYATNRIPASPIEEEDPLGQFAWLQDQLSTAHAAGRSVYIIGHIPPTVGSYRHTQLWETRYLQRYYQVLDKFGGNTLIQGQLFGHIHTDEFRLVSQDAMMEWPLWLAPSITPIYGSFPSIRVVEYESTTGALLDYATYYYDYYDDDDDNPTPDGSNNNNNQNKWTAGPTFRESFGVPDLSANSLRQVLLDLQGRGDQQQPQQQQENAWKSLLERQHVHTHGTEVCEDWNCRLEWLCTLTSISKAEYMECLMQESTALLSIGSKVVVVVVVCFVLMCSIRSIKQRLQRSLYEVPVELELDDGIGTEKDNAVEQAPSLSLPVVS